MTGQSRNGGGGVTTRKEDMRNRFESDEVFSKYVELEAIDWMIREEGHRLNSLAPKTIIDAEIDRVTGFGVSRDLDSIDRVKELLNQKIKCEIYLEIDPTNAREFMDKLNDLERQLTADIKNLQRKAGVS